MKINEIFGVTLQGEGQFAGAPSIFIRTNHCNLRCGFVDPVTKEKTLCDTFYTSWYPEDVKDMTSEEVVLKVIDIYNRSGLTSPVDIVISGGEPLLVKSDIIDLVETLRNVEFETGGIGVITIETNGTYFYPELMDYVDLFSISPKLSSSVPLGTKYEKMHEQNRTSVNSFRQYSNDLYNVQWKFVVMSENDVQEILQFQKDYGIQNCYIYLMPMGQTNQELDKYRKTVWDLCIKYNFNYTDRLHVLLYDNKRGI